MKKAKQQKHIQIRQGDVFLIPCAIPRGAKSVKRDKGHVILAYGETTGHFHGIKDAGAALLEHDGERYLQTDGCSLNHDEHSTLAIPAGTYKVVQQCEWTSEGIEAIRD